MRPRGFSRLATFGALAGLLLAAPVPAGSIFLTGHDPDFHGAAGSDRAGAGNINRVAVHFITDQMFNPFHFMGLKTVLYVESSLDATKLSDPGNHTNGGFDAVQAAIAPLELTLEKRDASTLADALDELGDRYAAVVVASDVGGLLSQAELDILNDRSDDILAFLNAGGGLYAMSESNLGSQLTPAGGHFGFLPFVESTVANQPGDLHRLTPFGLSLGLESSDVTGDFTHSIFLDDFGLNVVDVDESGRILSLAGRGRFGPGGPIPEPATIFLLGAGILALAGVRARKSVIWARSGR